MICKSESVHTCRDEPVVPEFSLDAAFCRPVARIPELGLIFTRIDPGNKETSMVFRVRPGWAELYRYLAGLQDAEAEPTGQKLRR